MELRATQVGPDVIAADLVHRCQKEVRGGLRILGYPITRPYARIEPDGTIYYVQDFERAQLEFHPEYLGGWGYAYLQVLQQAVEGAKSINDDKVADYLRNHAFTTIMVADVKFGKNGEWTKSGMLQVQYHDLTDGANLETWRGMSYQTVLTPDDVKTGNIIYPYEKALG